jgi:hypothetical protein
MVAITRMILLIASKLAVSGFSLKVTTDPPSLIKASLFRI